MEGQGTVALEILNAAKTDIDYLFMPIGGGGLAAGVSSYFKAKSAATRLMGVEPAGAAAMLASMEQGENKVLSSIDPFVDGTAVKQVGRKTFAICQKLLDKVITVPEGLDFSTLLQLYNEEAIVSEPAGVLSIAALEYYQEEIKGKTVVCILSGGNNDINRTEEIKQRALLHEGCKHYFIVNLAQKSGALRGYLLDVLEPDDDIVHFEYQKKKNRSTRPVIIGIEQKSTEDLAPLLRRMKEAEIDYEYLNDNQTFLQCLI